MSYSVHSLGSGSSGNSMLIQSENTRILLDAGLSALHLQKRLSKYRVSISNIDAVFLTHEHGDHTRGVYTLSKRFGVPVIANPATLTVLSRECTPPNWWTLDTGESTTIGDLVVESFPISHDAVDPVGYNIYHDKSKVSFVTDTGIAGRDVQDRIANADLAIIEANHDVERLLEGPYPRSLKQRILSDVGHLSNDAAADLILNYLATRRRPSAVWLGHLSDTNNTPRMARRHVQTRISDAGYRDVVLEVVLRDESALTWRAGCRLVQLDLFGN